jgi:hypothetical protein
MDDGFVESQDGDNESSCGSIRRMKLVETVARALRGSRLTAFPS